MMEMAFALCSPPPSMRSLLSIREKAAFPLGNPLVLSSSSPSHYGALFHRRSRILICHSSGSGSSIPARDIMIDFGKFKGCKMGTLPSTYLKWLIREVSETRFEVWAKYAEQVLEDPYYKDRLEWESIEKLSLKGDMKRRGSLIGGADAGVKGSMKALGWNLSDHDGWNKVNFSLLGTTLGGRIPRVEYVVDANKNPASIIPVGGSEIRKTRQASPKLTPSSSKSRASSYRNLDTTNEIVDSNMKKKPPEPETSLREELLRRRLLRKRIVQPKFSTLSQNNNTDGHGISQFLGRNALIKKIQNQADQ